MKRLIIIWLLSVASLIAQKGERPNILWIYAEDTSPWMGCYGDLINAEATPHIDSIANAGVRFDRAFVPAPVCSATRSALIVGQSGIRFGAHQHRSSRKGPKIYLPENVQTLPEILRAYGYTTFNYGKTDYNFVWNSSSYNYQLSDQTDFFDLITRQPFFGQIQTKGGKNNTWKFPEERKVDPGLVNVPADYPDNSIYRTVVAQHYDAIRMEDDLVGKILEGLEEAGLADNTIVVYFSDHGANNLVRHKQMTTEGGLHVPFLIVGPRRYVPSAQVRGDLVDMLDLSATTLAWAGVKKPQWYEGQDLFAVDFRPRSFVAAHKDRLDHTVDRVRSIRTDRFRYVRNYKLDRIFLQPQYRDGKAFTQNLHDLYRQGELSALHRRIYFGERPVEELYEVSVDPHMLVNLAADPVYVDILSQHRALLSDWLSGGDYGIGEESIQALQVNGEGTKWGEGVNVEYEAYRVDSDGDGLSDKWESLNGRDPLDGNLYYEFDCGGWQTEGWISPNTSSNIAGFLGYLDFYLEDKVATLRREGLKVIPKKENQTFILRLRSSKDLNVKVLINERLIGLDSIQASNEYERVSMNFHPGLGKEIVELLEIVFEGEEGAFVEIDTIQLETI
jgi:arylsulfatase A-like enzyme